MSFKLTPDFIFGLLDSAGSGNPGPLIETLEPEIRWRIGSEMQNDVVKTGVYNRATWMENVFGPFQTKLKDEIKLMPLDIEVVSNKAYVEFRSEATQLNGELYKNFYLWVMLFNEHGRAYEIREYLDTNHVREVMTNN